MVSDSISDLCISIKFIGREAAGPRRSSDYEQNIHELLINEHHEQIIDEQITNKQMIHERITCKSTSAMNSQGAPEVFSAKTL